MSEQPRDILKELLDASEEAEAIASTCEHVSEPFEKAVVKLRQLFDECVQNESSRYFCLGYTHDKCDNCQHQRNWDTLNKYPDRLRLTVQVRLNRVNDIVCRLTNMGRYIPIVEEPN